VPRDEIGIHAVILHPGDDLHPRMVHVHAGTDQEIGPGNRSDATQGGLSHRMIAYQQMVQGRAP
jgi:hypothetical protein